MFKDIEKEFRYKTKSSITIFTIIFLIVLIGLLDFYLIKLVKYTWWASILIIYGSMIFVYFLYERICSINECSSNDDFAYVSHKIAQKTRIDEIITLKEILKKYRADSKSSIKDMLEHYRTYTSRNVNSGSYMNYLSIIIAISSFMYSLNANNSDKSNLNSEYWKFQNIRNNFAADLIFLSVIYFIVNLVVKIFKKYRGKISLYEKLESLLSEMYFKYDDLFIDDDKLLFYKTCELLKKEKGYNYIKSKLYDLYKSCKYSNNFYDAVHTIKTLNVLENKFKNLGKKQTYTFELENIHFECRTIKDNWFVNNYYYIPNKEEKFIENFHNQLKIYLDKMEEKCKKDKINILVIGYYPIDYKDFEDLIEQFGVISLYNVKPIVKIPNGKINSEIYTQKTSLFRKRKKRLWFYDENLFEDKVYENISAIIINQVDVFNEYDFEKIILYPNKKAINKIPNKILRKFNRYKVTKREIKKIENN